MTVGSSDPSGTRPLLSASDPALIQSAGEWRDWTLPNRNLSFVAEGRIRSISWAELAGKIPMALWAATLGVAYVNAPGFDPHAPQGPGEIPGYGWAVGEADLREYQKFRILSSSNFQSFVSTIQFWESPAPSKGSIDTALVPHEWVVRVRAGRVYSSYVVSHGGPYRMFWEVAPTEDALGWIAKSVLAGLQ